MLVRILKRAGLGFLLGMAIGNVIAYLTCADSGALVNSALIAKVGDEAAAMILQTAVSGLLGAVSFGGTICHEIEEWSLLRAALTHCGLIFAAYIPAAYFLCWFGSLTAALISIALMGVSYLIVWLIMYAIYNRQVKDLNELQDKMREKQSADNKDHNIGGAENEF